MELMIEDSCYKRTFMELRKVNKAYLKEWMSDADMTQAELAELLEISPSLVRKMMMRNPIVPGKVTRMHICNTLGLSMEKLFPIDSP